jgi:hypothetical protein
MPPLNFPRDRLPDEEGDVFEERKIPQAIGLILKSMMIIVPMVVKHLNRIMHKAMAMAC